MVDKKKSEAAKKRWIGSEPSERKSLASKAAHARWSKASGIRVAEYVGEIRLAGTVLSCAVLDDGRRVLSERGVADALGHGRHPDDYARKQEALAKGELVLPGYLVPEVHGFLSEQAKQKLSNPIRYQIAKGFGIPAMGLDATLLADVCDAYLSAREAGVLPAKHQQKAQAASTLMRALARVALVALIDEATGYQVVRDRDELQLLLEKYVSEEFRPWMRAFPNEFYVQLFRLRKVTTDDVRKRPPYFGNLTNNVVYRRIIPGLLPRLNEVNPTNDRGRRSRAHHQHLEKEAEDHLRQHLSGVVALMKRADSWPEFMRDLERVFPKQELPTSDPVDSEA